jgi:hypothetical protein
VNPELRIDLDEQVDVIRHDLQCLKPGPVFVNGLADDRFHAFIDRVNEH